jgi:hypothetical protein
MERLTVGSPAPTHDLIRIAAGVATATASSGQELILSVEFLNPPELIDTAGYPTKV